MAKTKKQASRGQYVVGMDMGGTKILAAIVDEKGHIVAVAKKKTQAQEGPEAVIERMAQTAHQAARKARLEWSQIKGLGVGVPGPTNPELGVVYNAPNLPGWHEVPVGSHLAKVLGVPVFVENDVNLGTLGEFALGAGRGTQDLVGIFVGTGVGGGLILDGKLRSGFRHAAAEVGHMVVMADGPVCGCGRRGCLESVASRTAIERDIELGLAAGRESTVAKLVRSKGGRLTSGMLAKALQRGDPLVTEVMRRVQWYLGLHTASIVNFVDPEMVIFGGGVVEALGDEFVQPIGVTARQHMIQQRDADRVRIVAAELGDHAAVLGAAVLVRQKIETPHSRI